MSVEVVKVVALRLDVNPPKCYSSPASPLVNLVQLPLSHTPSLPKFRPGPCFKITTP